MPPFPYLCPRTLDQAFEVLSACGPDARVLAGGTDLLVRLRLGHIRPSAVIDIKRVRELPADIAEQDGAVRIGAGAVMSDIIADERVRTRFPALVEAARVVGSVQIRNRATLAGNICNASPAADTATPLLVYRAVVSLVSSVGRRRVPLAEFFTGPGRTVANAGELVESIDLPVAGGVREGAAFGRITRRYGVDLATINLCCLVSHDGTTRFAFGAVGPRPFMVVDDSGTLASGTSAADDRDAVLASLIAHASPISDVRATRDYREAMLAVMSRRTLEAARTRLRELGA